jgi:hypothetical protein
MQKTQLYYRVDGGSESYYTNDKQDAQKYYNYALEEYGEPIALWEIEEEWDEEGGTWEIADENIILSTDL